MDTFQHIVDKHTKKYNERYAEHGDDCRALGWPSEVDNRKRFRVMFDVVKDQDALEYSLLDFGCGLGHFYEWLDGKHWRPGYMGIDINENFIKTCEDKFGGIGYYKFCVLDILNDDDYAQLPIFDYIVCNGVFTEKLDTSWDDQWSYFTSIIKRLWQRTKHGLAFNVMSPVVDYGRPDLFHVTFDDMAWFVRFILGSRHFTFRHDYGLWEYTTYVYRE